MAVLIINDEFADEEIQNRPPYIVEIELWCIFEWLSNDLTLPKSSL